MILNMKIMGFVAAGAFALATITYFTGRLDGSRSCDARHVTAQQKQDDKTRKSYDKIERKVPYNADRAAKFEWLRNNSRP